MEVGDWCFLVGVLNYRPPLVQRCVMEDLKSGPIMVLWGCCTPAGLNSEQLSGWSALRKW